jgi:hypothetical protein
MHKIQNTSRVTVRRHGILANGVFEPSKSWLATCCLKYKVPNISMISSPSIVAIVCDFKTKHNNASARTQLQRQLHLPLPDDDILQPALPCYL